MKPGWSFVIASVLLAGCSKAPPEPTYGETLPQYQSALARIEQLESVKAGMLTEREIARAKARRLTAEDMRASEEADWKRRLDETNTAFLRVDLTVSKSQRDLLRISVKSDAEMLSEKEAANQKRQYELLRTGDEDRAAELLKKWDELRSDAEKRHPGNLKDLAERDREVSTLEAQIAQLETRRAEILVSKGQKKKGDNRSEKEKLAAFIRSQEAEIDADCRKRFAEELDPEITALKKELAVLKTVQEPKP